jgi:hypothetical protein
VAKPNPFTDQSIPNKGWHRTAIKFSCFCWEWWGGETEASPVLQSKILATTGHGRSSKPLWLQMIIIIKHTYKRDCTQSNVKIYIMGRSKNPWYRRGPHLCCSWRCCIHLSLPILLVHVSCRKGPARENPAGCQPNPRLAVIDFFPSWKRNGR